MLFVHLVLRGVTFLVFTFLFVGFAMTLRCNTTGWISESLAKMLRNSRTWKEFPNRLPEAGKYAALSTDVYEYVFVRMRTIDTSGGDVTMTLDSFFELTFR